ncbi:MAG TPA: dihydrofolate reductase family protein [Steroidobacteraceae bacterium]|nr:dihydrofolate reductase family protein [Steroidobacteraceae bacterium]
MRKLTILEHISLDGVIQAPGAPDEDRDDGFERGGWVAPHDDPLVAETIAAAHGQSFDLLLGRRTYDIWSGYWPNAGSSPMADSLNEARKYVATHRPDDLDWGPVEDLGADIAEGVRRIKSGNGPDLIVWGSSTLMPVLLRQGLADEVVLLVYPILLGQGKRFLPEGSVPRELAVVSTRTTPSGVQINRYRPTGPLRTGSVAGAA